MKDYYTFFYFFIWRIRFETIEVCYFSRTEKSLESIREPSLGIEVKLKTKASASFLSDDEASDVNTSFASDSDDDY
jgi:hypothetical protein